MGHGKETPRQKMIGMMYLVLTALLAMNVSKDVLNAFILVDEGLTKTTHNFFQKNESLYDDFEAAYQLNKTKVADWKSKADEVRKMTQELYDLMQEDKKIIVRKGEGEDTPAITAEDVLLKEVKGKDNNNIPAEVMILNKKGTELKEKIAQYREYLFSLVENKEDNASLIASLESGLNTEDPAPDIKKGEEQRSWEVEHFEHLPLAAVITMLSKMQSDIRNAESEIITYLLTQIDAGSFKFNKIDAVVISNSDYIFKGQEYKASVFLAAYDSTKQPEVVLENGTKLEVKDGKGVYSAVGSSVGTRTWAGTIVLDNGDGTNVIRRDFKKEYQVAEASAVISPTKMNVFYRGVKNPVSISVSGVPKEDLMAEISKGNIKRVGNDWEVFPGSGPEGEKVTVRVSAKIDNVTRFMGSMEFRVKDVPDPVAEVAGRFQGSIGLGELSKAGGVKATLKNFDFDLDFVVTEFTVSAMLSGGFTKTEKSDGATYSKAQIDIISQLKNGQRVTFESIKAVGPDGKNRTLNSIVLKIN
jgi:gliding motility-associated protein GldM